MIASVLGGCGAADAPTTLPRRSCDGLHPVDVDAVVVASDDPAAPVGTLRHAVWSLSCFDDEDPDIDAEWPDLLGVGIAPARAAQPIGCGDGERASLFEAVSHNDDSAVFSPGEMTIGWFVTDALDDGCDPSRGVRWEFNAFVRREVGGAGQPDFVPSGAVTAAVVSGPALPVDGPATITLEWDECTGFCSIHLRVTTPDAADAPSTVPVVEPRLTLATLGEFDPYGGPIELEPIDGCMTEFGNRQRTAWISPTGGTTFASATGMRLELPAAVASGLGADTWTCTAEQRALAGAPYQAIEATIVDHRGFDPPGETLPTRPAIDVDIAPLGSDDASLAADVSIGRGERLDRLDRTNHRTEYALAEFGPFVVVGLVAVALAMRSARRTRRLGRLVADERDVAALVAEACRNEAERSRAARTQLAVVRSIGARAIVVEIAVLVPLLVVSRLVGSPRLDDAVMRTLVAFVGLGFVMAVAGPISLWAARSMRTKRTAAIRRLVDREIAEPTTDLDVAAVMVAVIDELDELPSDTILQSVGRGEGARTASVADDFAAATAIGQELVRVVSDACPTGPKPHVDRFAPKTVASEEFVAWLRRCRLIDMLASVAEPSPDSDVLVGPPDRHTPRIGLVAADHDQESAPIPLYRPPSDVGMSDPTQPVDRAPRDVGPEPTVTATDIALARGNRAAFAITSIFVGGSIALVAFGLVTDASTKSELRAVVALGGAASMAFRFAKGCLDLARMPSHAVTVTRAAIDGATTWWPAATPGEATRVIGTTVADGIADGDTVWIRAMPGARTAAVMSDKGVIIVRSEPALPPGARPARPRTPPAAHPPAPPPHRNPSATRRGQRKGATGDKRRDRPKL